MKSKILKPRKVIIVGGHSTPAFAVLDEILKLDLNKATHPYPPSREESSKQADLMSSKVSEILYENPTPSAFGHSPLKDKGGEIQVVWVGEKHNQRGNRETSAEYKTVTEKYKIRFINLVSGKLVRAWSFSTFFGGLIELFNLSTGFVKSFFIILKEKPDLVISFGGFTAVPIVINAKIFGKKVITHEQTIVAGLANQIIAKFADVVCITFEDSFKFYPKEKTVLTGNPIRKDIFEIKSSILNSINAKLPTVYITGGNQGAHEINKRVFEILPELLEWANIVHQTGNSTITGDFQKAKQLEGYYSEKSTNGRYLCFDYIYQSEIGEVFNKADLILSRAGANSVLEILALGKLAIFIPIPWASHDEQTKNAKFVESIGLGKVITQTDDLSSKELLAAISLGLKKKTQRLGFNDVDLGEVVREAKSRVKLDAARKVWEIGLGLI